MTPRRVTDPMAMPTSALAARCDGVDTGAVTVLVTATPVGVVAEFVMAIPGVALVGETKVPDVLVEVGVKVCVICH